ncbi:DUF1493 family protein [Cronobacter malonaticus]|uniref:DUF1493 family protein n=1 Tax=Cronobacter malonaticus TaxID=413503 RepID=UPI002894BF2D|nr:DUF1493 family protein [Cronobacter malonaticus]ELY5941127.1 DUF1493 family protein [Cronobacter malonaticus]ELY6205502.1 DUF1493 family protein [Cronobacter malonaticus]ELY6257874.1 DUF1493 family protein [Cronobacter malonaticus]MDT3562195.1 DUF1493 family protein [Cronobacter malonaticus]
MMNKEEAEQAVLDWYRETWNGKSFISGKPWKLDLDTCLTTGEHPWVVETGEEIMEDYFSRFDVDKTGFNLLKYWPVEPGWIPNVLLPASMRIKRVAPAPLTLRMLAESAKAGHWLYE